MGLSILLSLFTCNNIAKSFVVIEMYPRKGCLYLDIFRPWRSRTHIRSCCWCRWLPKAVLLSLIIINYYSLLGGESCCIMGTTRSQLMEHETGSNNLSLSQNGPRNLWPSISNYVVQLSSSEKSGSPVAFLYFLDSGGGSYPEVISDAQTKWFSSTSQKINPDSR